MLKVEKAIFLDRDGVINEDFGYVSKIENFKLINGVIDSLILLQKNNFLLFIVTNQSGIARDFYSIDDFKKINNYMLDLFEKNGIKISSVEFCPHHIDGKIKELSINCNCRKPKTGMFENILKNFHIDKNNSYMIGDKISDIQAGNNIGLNTVLISHDLKKTGADFIENNLYSATKNVILKK